MWFLWYFHGKCARLHDMKKSFLPNVEGHPTQTGEDVDTMFREFYARTAPSVRRYVIRRLMTDVDDVVESVFVTAWQRADSMPDGADDQLVWLYAIARRKIANFVRVKRRRDRFSLKVDEERNSSNAGSDDSSTTVVVHHALSQLSPSKREILLLVEWDGLTVDQAATVLGISSPAAGKRLWAARNSFRSLCEAQFALATR